VEAFEETQATPSLEDVIIMEQGDIGDANVKFNS